MQKKTSDESIAEISHNAQQLYSRVFYKWHTWFFFHELSIFQKDVEKNIKSKVILKNAHQKICVTSPENTIVLILLTDTLMARLAFYNQLLIFSVLLKKWTVQKTIVSTNRNENRNKVLNWGIKLHSNKLSYFFFFWLLM